MGPYYDGKYTMTDVILISPPGSTAERLYSMSEVGGLSAVLKQKGFRSLVIDGIYFGDQYSRIIEILSNERPALVGFVFQWEHQPFIKWTQGVFRVIQKNKNHYHIRCCGQCDSW